MFLTFAMISFVAGLALWLRGRAISRNGREDGASLPTARVGRRAHPVVKEHRSEGSFWIFTGKLFMVGGGGLFGIMYAASELFGY